MFGRINPVKLFKIAFIVLVIVTLTTLYRLRGTEVHFGSSTPPASFIAKEAAKIKTSPQNYKFKWENWLNISFAENYADLIQDEAVYPEFNRFGAGQFPPKMSKRVNREEAKLFSAKYLMDIVPAPQQVILLPQAKQGLPVSAPQVIPVQHADPERTQKRTGSDKYIDLCNLVNAQAQTRPKTVKKILALNIPKQDYQWDLAKEIDLSPEFHQPSMRMALEKAGIEPKYFKESIVKDEKGFNKHYDVKFFSGIETRCERQNSIHNLFKAWSHFALSFNIPYVLGHGTALGWHWNGLALPWDLDGDIQMPMKALHNLATLFNSTLIVPPAGKGKSRAYYLDVNPYYGYREENNGKNLIDARFIDITSGSYIDITGLGNTKSEPDLFTCKNNHDYPYEEISTYELTSFEGALAYTVKEFQPFLLKEFPAGFEPVFRDWTFSDKMRLWIKDNKKCSLNEKYPEEVCFESITLPVKECRVDLQCCDLIDILEYESTQEYTKRHLKLKELREKERIASGSTEVAEISSELVDLLSIDMQDLHRNPTA